MRSVSTIERTNVDELVERKTKVEYGDLGVGHLKIRPRICNRCEIATLKAGICRFGL